ncbi:hypothetical protein EDB81DRAFT_760602 [Dactylonectria macrodidyma]|uniref:BZIP domain-containing protein n=1 Tax=Dactylonectria macrodidyma TaxID=307937 RepID=A0A9P9ELL3_9HYPO|nr:hypothetical protein EDB81DRAFT_760602 [Dactylonectria macrodidyma]
MSSSPEEDNKRAQNRAAQKNFRKKQQSRLEYLEAFVKATKSGQASHDEDNRYYTLLRGHLKLLGENRHLRDNLIGLRQKLTYISQSAAAVAGDGAIDSLLKDDGNERSAAVSSPLMLGEPRQDSVSTQITTPNKSQIAATMSAGFIIALHTVSSSQAMPVTQAIANSQVILPASSLYSDRTMALNVTKGTKAFDTIHPFTDPSF